MSYNTVKLKKYSNVIEEYAAAASITPGMLLELTSSDTVQAHSAQGRNILPMFALEDELQGNGLEDNYVAGDKVQVWIPNRGDQVYAVLVDGENIAIGDFLESNGDGALRKHVPDSWESAEDQVANTIYQNAIVGVAVEAKDLSDSSGVDSSVGVLGYNKRIAVRIY
jgi:hypothetical protein